MLKFKAIRSDSIVINLINDDNYNSVLNMFSGFEDSNYMLLEIEKSFRPMYDKSGRRTKYGFYTLFNDELAGLSLLGISSWQHLRGYTGADTLSHLRGEGVAPSSKPLLFYLAFDMLGLNRVETGCFISNIASRKSIEKTAGLKFEGILREYAINSKGQFEDEYRYAILKSDWLKIRQNYNIKVI
ncbi:MAG: GNAT family protein [Candidatus Zixiibacteriota bacterium]